MRARRGAAFFAIYLLHQTSLAQDSDALPTSQTPLVQAPDGSTTETDQVDEAAQPAAAVATDTPPLDDASGKETESRPPPFQAPPELATWATSLAVFPACDLHAAVEVGPRWLLACGDAGVWEVMSQEKLVRDPGHEPGLSPVEFKAESSATPAPPGATEEAAAPQTTSAPFVLMARTETAGRAVAFRKTRDGLLVVLQTYVAVSYRDLKQPPPEPKQAAAPSPPPPSTPEVWGQGDTPPEDLTPKSGREVGTIVGTRPLRVLVSDHENILKSGDSASLGASPHAVVGRVVGHEGDVAVIRVGMGEAIPEKGTVVVTTTRSPTRKLAFPLVEPYTVGMTAILRVGSAESFETTTDFRGFEDSISSQTTSFATELDAHFNRRSLRVGAALMPYARFNSSLKTYEAFGYVSYEPRTFGIGVDLGAARVLKHGLNPPGTGILFGPQVRVGPQDGLHFEARGSLYLHRKALLNGSVHGAFQVPLHERFFLQVRGSFGRTGYYVTELGFKSMVLGGGGPGSLFMGLLAGYSGVLSENHGESSGGHASFLIGTRL